MSDTPNDQNTDLPGDKGPAEPTGSFSDIYGKAVEPLNQLGKGEVPPELADPEGIAQAPAVEPTAEVFDITKFLPQSKGLLVLPTVKSNTSKNVYTCLATKGASLVGVSITLEAAKTMTEKGVQPVLVLVTRYLEVPEVGSPASVFANPGEERPYLLEGEERTVYMLRKDTMPLCSAMVSPWEVRYHLDAGVRDQLTAWVLETLSVSGCALSCKEDEIQDILFSRLNQLADSPALLWKDLNGHTPEAM